LLAGYSITKDISLLPDRESFEGCEQRVQHANAEQSDSDAEYD